MKRGLLIIVALFLIAAVVLSYFDRGREPGPIEIAEDMRARACGGELEEFNAYLDKEAVELALKRSELERMRKDFIYSTTKEPHGSLKVRDIIVNTVPELLSFKLQLYSKQVRAGEFGPICNMELVRVGSNESTVKIRFPGGERSTWGFGKVGQEWKLVSIRDVLPLTLASLKSGKKKAVNGKPPYDNTSSEIVPDPGAAESSTQPVLKEGTKEQAYEPEDHTARIEAPDQTDQPHGAEDKNEIETTVIDNEPEEVVEIIAGPSGHDFRNTSWGMTPAQVQAAEGTEPGIKGPDELVYNTYFKGESVKVRYKFTVNALKSGGVIFLNEHPEEIFYVQDYEKRKGDLTAQYGEPVIDEEIWYNRLYEGAPERMGFAVAIGHLKLRTKWRTESSDILLELKSEDYNMILVLSFHSL